MTDQRTTCRVVGGGPAGMALGLLLARSGVDAGLERFTAEFTAAAAWLADRPTRHGRPAWYGQSAQRRG